jgi:hypothetical protein
MFSPPSDPHVHVCQAILETGSVRKLSHNGCTAANFDLPDHDFLERALHNLVYRVLQGL